LPPVRRHCQINELQIKTMKAMGYWPTARADPD
jgi:hypothetical protein